MTRNFHWIAVAVLGAGLAFAGEPMTNETIIKMVQSGVPTDTIVKTIQAADSFRFGTLPGDLTQLEAAHVPVEVIKALAARINWVGPRPGGISHAPIIPPPTVGHPASLTNGYLAQAQDGLDGTNGYLFKGAHEIVMSGSGFVTHNPSSNGMSLAGFGADTFVSRGDMIGVGLLTSGIQAVFLAGTYRHYVKTRDARLFPFAGVTAGTNLVQLSSSPFTPNDLARAELGLRYFVMRHVAIDVAYNLQYLHTRGFAFGSSTSSAVSLGFAHVF
jgi:hypothetical protein